MLMELARNGGGSTVADTRIRVRTGSVTALGDGLGGLVQPKVAAKGTGSDEGHLDNAERGSATGTNSNSSVGDSRAATVAS
jgi:hypothetical protein